MMLLQFSSQVNGVVAHSAAMIDSKTEHRIEFMLGAISTLAKLAQQGNCTCTGFVWRLQIILGNVYVWGGGGST